LSISSLKDSAVFILATSSSLRSGKIPSSAKALAMEEKKFLLLGEVLTFSELVSSFSLSSLPTPSGSSNKFSASTSVASSLFI